MVPLIADGIRALLLSSASVPSAACFRTFPGRGRVHRGGSCPCCYLARQTLVCCWNSNRVGSICFSGAWWLGNLAKLRNQLENLSPDVFNSSLFPSLHPKHSCWSPDQPSVTVDTFHQGLDVRRLALRPSWPSGPQGLVGFLISTMGVFLSASCWHHGNNSSHCYSDLLGEGRGREVENVLGARLSHWVSMATCLLGVIVFTLEMGKRLV